MNPFRTGKLVLFQVTYDRDWHFFEIIFFVILGIFGVSLSTPSTKLTDDQS
jgi:chloride channel 3/4/5